MKKKSGSLEIQACHIWDGEGELQFHTYRNTEMANGDRRNEIRSPWLDERKGVTVSPMKDESHLMIAEQPFPNDW